MKTEFQEWKWLSSILMELLVTQIVAHQPNI